MSESGWGGEPPPRRKLGDTQPVPALDLLHAPVAFAAAFLAGLINSVAGGGTLLTFPTLIWLGLSSVTANATSTVAVWPGTLASCWGYRRELRTAEGRLLWLLVPSVIGGLAGASLLRFTPLGELGVRRLPPERKGCCSSGREPAGFRPAADLLSFVWQQIKVGKAKCLNASDTTELHGWKESSVDDDRLRSNFGSAIQEDC